MRYRGMMSKFFRRKRLETVWPEELETKHHKLSNLRSLLTLPEAHTEAQQPSRPVAQEPERHRRVTLLAGGVKKRKDSFLPPTLLSFLHFKS